jgi:hypothetical protein
LAKTVAAKWKEIAPADKEEYEKVAAAGRAVYVKRAKAWKKQQRRIAKEQKKNKHGNDEVCSSGIYNATMPTANYRAGDPQLGTMSNTEMSYSSDTSNIHSPLARATYVAQSIRQDPLYTRQHYSGSMRVPAIAPVQMMIRPASDNYHISNVDVERNMFGRLGRATSMPGRVGSPQSLPDSLSSSLYHHLDRQSNTGPDMLSISLPGERNLSVGNIFPLFDPNFMSRSTQSMPTQWDGESIGIPLSHPNRPYQPRLPYAPVSQPPSANNATATLLLESPVLRDDLLLQPLEMDPEQLDPPPGVDNDDGHPYAGLFDDR